MTTMISEAPIQTLDITKEIQIAAPLEISFEALLEELGPGSEMPDGTPMKMVLEAWPGGRWYRDLGDKKGHFWGHVQVIKPPTLLEICGPLFMSYPAVSHIQYRLTNSGGGTLVQLTHRAMGLITAEHREGVQMGWEYGLKRVREIADRLAAGRGGKG